MREKQIAGENACYLFLLYRRNLRFFSVLIIFCQKIINKKKIEKKTDINDKQSRTILYKNRPYLLTSM